MPLWRRGWTIRLLSRSSRVRYPYSAPLLFFLPFLFPLFFFSMGGGVLCMYVPFFFATHHPPVIITCSWGSVGPLPCTSHMVRLGFSVEKLSWFQCRVPASAWLVLVWKIWRLSPSSCRCGVGGETIRLSSRSSRVRYPYSAHFLFFSLFFFLFFFSMGGGVLCIYVFVFFLQHTTHL